MELLDSRRLTGPNILWERPGAVLDVAVADERREDLVAAWSAALRLRLEALGWGAEDLRVRAFPGGASLAVSAPMDALYAATEVNESAWQAALAQLQGEEPQPLEPELERLRAEIAREANPALIALRDAAHARGLACLCDDDQVSIGLGTGSRTWDVGALPSPDEVPWDELHDVPTAMVTGTNGKTTTVRMLERIARAAGLCAGTTSTDGLRVGDETLESGDWSGPGGARRVLRDRRTEVALLETARGGMLRRGLALERCDVSAVLNVGADHLGEWGVGSLQGLAEGKFVVTGVARRVVLNADDPVVVERARGLRAEVLWFGLRPDSPLVAEHLHAGGRACVLDAGALWLCEGSVRRRLLGVDEVPATLNGAARYNVANALAALAVAVALELPEAAILEGLRRFESDPATNPGRLNRFDLGGVQAIVDFAHNPHGFAALFELTQNLPAERRLVLLGQAGDRDEASIRELARTTWAARPDMIVIKELTEHLRGREPGEIPALIESELRAAGAPDSHFVHCPSELAAVEWALAWSRPGDLLLLLTHDHREAVLARLTELQDRARTGEP